MSNGQYWIPYLSDNVYRLAAQGSQTTISQLRQVVKRIEAGYKVGITPKVPLANLLGISEVGNISAHLKQVSADPAALACHKLLWFFNWIPDGLELDNVSSIVNGVSQDNYFQAHTYFLHNLFVFLDSHDADAFEECLDYFDAWYSDGELDDYLIDLLAQDTGISSDLAQERLYEAQQIVAQTVLNTGVHIAIQYLESKDFETGREILSVVVNSPLDDDWKDVALSRVSEFVRPLANRVKATTENFRSWQPEHKDPHVQDCEKIRSLLRLLKGRVTEAIEWESVVQGWIDKQALAMANYAVEQINELLETLPRVRFSSMQEKLRVLSDLHNRLRLSQKILEQALSKQPSPQVRRHISGLLEQTKEIISQLPPVPSSPLSLFSSSQSESQLRTRSAGRPTQERLSPSSSSQSESQSGSCSCLIMLLLCLVLCFGIIRYCMSDNANSESDSNAAILAFQNDEWLEDYQELKAKADSFMKSGKYRQAKETYARAIRLARENKVSIQETDGIYYSYANALEKLGDRSTAIWAFRTYITKNPKGKYAASVFRKLEKYGVIKRPRTGQSPLGNGRYAGYSEIVIDNQAETDAFVKVIRVNNEGSEMIRNLYIRAGDSAKATRVPSGEYVIKVAYGKGWIPREKRFLLERSFSKSQSFIVKEYNYGNSVHSSSINLTLHKVVGSNFFFDEITENEF